jgi:Xaa-Pro aminopeptidase
MQNADNICHRKGVNVDLATAKTRLQTLRKGLKQQHIPAMIVLSVENIRYLTGFTGHDSWLLVLPEKAVLITDSRYTEQARGECKGCAVFERKGGLAAAAMQFIEKYRGIRKLGLEDTAPISLLKTIKKTIKCTIIPTGGLVEPQRAIKTAEEVKAIETAAKIAWTALRRTLPLAKTGMTEAELAAALDFNMKMLGGTAGFDTIVCFGANASRNHHQPGGRKLKQNDTILIDFGCKYDGYTCDITRCFVVGKPAPYYRKAYEAVAAAQKAAIEMVKPGVRMADVDAACRKVLADAKVAIYGHGTGHGIGLEVHEAPRISSLAKKETFAPGQVITIEPGSYESGKLGIRIEDDILVTEKGCKLLTRIKGLWFDPQQVTVIKSK